jgi:hypothetical protein
MKCKLCLKDRELCDSHVIPEFFYKATYNEKHRMVALKERDPKIYYPRKGEYEPLLCNECENFLNKTYETYFSDLWYVKKTLPSVFNKNKPFIVSGIDYVKFRLFLLSIFWRASISSRKVFSKISLGKHEEIIRLMLKHEDPGSVLSYQIFGSLLLFPGKNKVLNDIIIPPFTDSFEGVNVCLSVFGGCAWYCVVADKPLLNSFALSPSGILQLPVHDAFDVKPIVSFLEDRLLMH